MADHPRDADRLIYAGLLGLAAAGVLQLVEKDELDWPQMIAVYCFATSLPLLAVGVVTDYARRAGTHVPRLHDVVGILGALAAVSGLGALLWHFQTGVGVLFILLVVLSIALVRRL